MPITKAAVKALRQSEKRRGANRGMKKKLHEELKEMYKLAQAKKMDDFKKLLPAVSALIDKAAKNNLLHKNNASRKKSRLANMLAAK